MPPRNNAILVPIADSPANDFVQDAVGNKADAAVAVVGVVASIMAYVKAIVAAVLGLGRMYQTVTNRTTGDVTFPVIDTERPILSLNDEANSNAFRGRLKIRVAIGFTYTVHRYENIDGAESEFAEDIINAVGSPQARDYDWIQTEDIRFSIECDNISGTANFEYGYDSKGE